MKRMSFVLMTAMALAAAPAAIAQQAQGSGSGSGEGTGQGRATQPLCRDAKGATYSQGALIRDAEGDVVRCEGGKWEPAPPSATGAQTAQGSGQGQGRTVTVVPQPGTAVSMTNVRLDLTVTDQSGGGQPIKKAISLLVAERGNGRVRSVGMAVPQGAPSYSVSLNADAEIARIEGNLIRIHVTVEYSPAAPETGVANRGSQLSQTVTVVLTNGKPTVIVQAADPLTDRKVTLEATATIVR